MTLPKVPFERLYAELTEVDSRKPSDRASLPLWEEEVRILKSRFSEWMFHEAVFGDFNLENVKNDSLLLKYGLV